MKSKKASEYKGVDQLGDFTSVSSRLYLLSSLALIVGIISAFVAVALLALINFFTSLFFYGKFDLTLKLVSPAGNALGPFVIVIPVTGSLIVGLMARYGSERIRGHGIPEALESILITRSKMEPKIAILKPVATAISIGSGGPFGAEGPIIMTGGAFGSVFAQFLKLTAMERKTLLVAGAAAGMAAVFNTPVAAVLIAVELLLFEWKPRSLIPVAIASVTATVLRGLILGTSPLFPIPTTMIPTIPIIAFSIVVGLAAGALSTALTFLVYLFEDGFRKLPIHWMWWPVIGGVAIGIGGFYSPLALGVGYNVINSLLLGQITLGIIVGLLITKALIWSIALGSGTSGGVLAPLLIMGGSLGAVLSQVAPAGPSSLWVLVAMGAVLGGTMRSPFTGVVFSLELTHNVNALLPLLIGAVFAEFVTVFTMKRSILTEKVARRGIHVAREYSVDVLEMIPVRSVMHKEIQPVEGDATVEDLIDVARKEKVPGFPIVDALGALQGFLTRSELLEYAVSTKSLKIPVRELNVHQLVRVLPNEPLRVAADRMTTISADTIPVVDPEDTQKVVGLLTREDLFKARVLWFSEEKDREHFLSIRDPVFNVIYRVVRNRKGSPRRERDR